MDKFFRTVKKIHRESVKANNRAVREQKRREREDNAYYMALQKEEYIQNSAEEVSRWNSYIEGICSLHKSCSASINWTDIEARKEPKRVFLGTYHKELAQKSLNSYKPTFLHKIFKQTHKNIAKLKKALQTAEDQDLKDYEKAQIEYEQVYEEWEKLNRLSRAVKKGDPQSYLDVVQHFNFLSGIGNLGTVVELNILEDFIDVDLFVNNEEIRVC